MKANISPFPPPWTGIQSLGSEQSGWIQTWNPLSGWCYHRWNSICGQSHCRWVVLENTKQLKDEAYYHFEFSFISTHEFWYLKSALYIARKEMSMFLIMLFIFIKALLKSVKHSIMMILLRVLFPFLPVNVSNYKEILNLLSQCFTYWQCLSLLPVFLGTMPVKFLPAVCRVLIALHHLFGCTKNSLHYLIQSFSSSRVLSPSTCSSLRNHLK